LSLKSAHFVVSSCSGDTSRARGEFMRPRTRRLIGGTAAVRTHESSAVDVVNRIHVFRRVDRLRIELSRPREPGYDRSSAQPNARSGATNVKSRREGYSGRLSRAISHEDTAHYILSCRLDSTSEAGRSALPKPHTGPNAP
jgi:hypothetical protein